MTRVIATDAQERAMLAVIRSLGAAGTAVTAVASSRVAPGLWSTATSSRTMVADPNVSVAAFIDDLERLVREQPHDLLLPGTDASLLALSRNRERLEPYVRLGMPDAEAVERALNRAEVSRAARAVGLDPPDERICEGVEQAVEAVESFGYPVVIKPVEVVIERDGAMRRTGAALARNRYELEYETGKLDRCIVQQLAQGDVVSFSGVAGEGGLLGYAMAHYDRIWPAEAGNACFSRSVQVPAGLAAQVEAFCAELGWLGIFQLELIAEPGGRLRTIDFNPRPYGSLGLAVDAGAPLPQIWADALLGRTPDRRVARPGVRYRWEDADLRHVLWQLRRGERRAALAAASPRRSVSHAYVSARDPLPAIVRAGELLRRAGEKARDR
jgi:predicted ATP-grasp superfamily ATP-dependent carboligase